MLEICITVVLVAGMCGYLANKYLNQRQQELDARIQVNTSVSEDTLNAALEELNGRLDQRINKSFENHALVRQEFESLRLAIGLKGNKL